MGVGDDDGGDDHERRPGDGRSGRDEQHHGEPERTSPADVLTVTAATLQSIAVTPANPSIAKGLTQQFTATGTYSDGSTQNLTTQVTWASATTSVATITSGGLATGVATGTSTISATLGGITGSTVLTVTPQDVLSFNVLSERRATT